MSLSGKKIAVMAGPEFEDLELFYPLLRLKEEGAEVKVIAQTMDGYCGKHGLAIRPDLTFKGARPEEFDALVIPGGWAPGRLRRVPEVLEFTRRMFQMGKIVASICHGPQILISAGVLKGKKIACVSAIKDDVINAGATFLDAPVVRDGNLISSRIPRDLPDFCREIIKALRES